MQANAQRKCVWPNNELDLHIAEMENSAVAKRTYDLPATNALVSFEAAARHGGFKNAATELNVTPAAVSHQIKALEIDLGCSLFLRRSRGVELTEKGAFLFVAIRRGFEAI